MMDTDMDTNFVHDHRTASVPRVGTGCWTCRVRRKKCDENYPVCDACAALRIACNYDPIKPDWMDNGKKQQEMAARLKLEVKSNAPRRRAERSVQISSERRAPPPKPANDPASMGCSLTSIFNVHHDDVGPSFNTSTVLHGQVDSAVPAAKDPRGAWASKHLEHADIVLIMFYLEHLLPFLFPFYRPSLLQGGRAWMMEMMIKSPVIRQAALCQASYFFSLLKGRANQTMEWDTVLTQTKDAFEVLRQALRVLHGSTLKEHMHGAVRVMSSILQVLRFEIAVSNFDNCRMHLNAALDLFIQLLNDSGATEPASRFETLAKHLSQPVSSAQWLDVPTAEQAALHFSSALLILDDIISSTILQEKPRLSEYHHGLLGRSDGAEPSINLEDVIGCQNWVMVEIGKIATLDAWQQQSKKAGNLDVVELVHRATLIKGQLEDKLAQLEARTGTAPRESVGPLEIFTADYCPQTNMFAGQALLATHVWAHAALIYLSVVVSGWQPARADVRLHVSKVIELLLCQMSPPALLRTMVWPFCVAGCLAEPSQEAHLRGMVEALQPPGVFGTVHKALDIMEYAWRNRDSVDTSSRSLAACFRTQGDLVLLV